MARAARRSVHPPRAVVTEAPDGGGVAYAAIVDAQPTDDPEPLAAGPALIRVATTLADLYEARSRAVGLSATQARLLFVLAEQPTNMLGLGASVRLGKSTMTSAIDRMEAAGLLRRTPDPDDRRRLVVTLTEAGVDAARAFEASMREAVTRLLGPLAEGDRAVLGRLLSVILGESERLLRSE